MLSYLMTQKLIRYFADFQESNTFKVHIEIVRLCTKLFLEYAKKKQKLSRT